jgi:hypothetical protein
VYCRITALLYCGQSDKIATRGELEHLVAEMLTQAEAACLYVYDPAVIDATEFLAGEHRWAERIRASANKDSDEENDAPSLANDLLEEWGQVYDQLAARSKRSLGATERHELEDLVGEFTALAVGACRCLKASDGTFAVRNNSGSRLLRCATWIRGTAAQ